MAPEQLKPQRIANQVLAVGSAEELVEGLDKLKALAATIN